LPGSPTVINNHHSLQVLVLELTDLEPEEDVEFDPNDDVSQWSSAQEAGLISRYVREVDPSHTPTPVPRRATESVRAQAASSSTTTTTATTTTTTRSGRSVKRRKRMEDD